jgi:pimeloyl-ACP methyl ester carboxylesterase
MGKYFVLFINRFFVSSFIFVVASTSLSVELRAGGVCDHETFADIARMIAEHRASQSLTPLELPDERIAYDEKLGMYFVHSSGAKIRWTLSLAHPDTGTMVLRPNLKYLEASNNFFKEPRVIFDPDKEKPTALDERLAASRVPYDAEVLVPLGHGGGTINSNNFAMGMLGNFLMAPFNKKDSGLQKALHFDLFRLPLAVEAPDHPGAPHGLPSSQIADTADMMAHLDRYFRDDLRDRYANGRPIVPIGRSASTAYYLEYALQNDGVLDGLILMSPMHHSHGLKAGIDALYEDHKDDPEVIDEPNLEMLKRVYGGMDWSTVLEEGTNFPVLVLVGGKDRQVTPEVKEFYKKLVEVNNSKNPEVPSFYIEIDELGHEVLSWQQPEHSLRAFYAVQSFLYRIRYPQHHARFDGERHDTIREYALISEGPEATKQALQAAKEGLQALTEERAEINRRQKNIGSAYYFNYQLNLMLSITEEEGMSELLTQLNSIREDAYRTLSDGSLQGYQDLPFEERKELENRLYEVKDKLGESFKPVRKKDYLEQVDDEEFRRNARRMNDIDSEKKLLNKKIAQLKRDQGDAGRRINEYPRIALERRALLRQLELGMIDSISDMPHREHPRPPGQFPSERKQEGDGSGI